MSAMAPSIAHNIWYGHYNPAAISPSVSVSSDRKNELINAFNRPFKAPGDVHDFFALAGRTLPAFQRIAELMRSPNVNILTDCTNLPIYREHGGKRDVIMPQDISPLEVVIPMLNTVSVLLPVPDGVRMPERSPVSSHQEASKLLWAEYFWRTALFETFAFQAIVEMEGAGLKAAKRTYCANLLGPTDLAIFRILRRDGMEGIAASYRHFMLPDMGSLLASFIASRADALVAGGAGVFSWTPPVRGERPPLQRTFLDEAADRYDPFEKGLYTRAEGLLPLDASEKGDVERRLAERVSFDEDVRDVLDLIGILAPRLSEQILAPEILEKIDFKISSDVPPGAVVMMLDSFMPMARSRPASEYKIEIHIMENAVKADVLGQIVGMIARVSLPEPLRGSEGFRDLSVDEIVRYLKGVYSRGEMWGWSAYFELMHEAEARGVELPPMEDRHVQMRRMLDECGMGVLCEQFDRFSNPAFTRMMEAQFMNVAKMIRAQRH